MPVEDGQNLRDFARKITAELASAIVLFTIEKGTIISNVRGLEKKLSAIADASWLAKSNNLIENYGWESTPDFKQIQSELGDFLTGTGESPSPDWRVDTPDQIKRRLERFCRNHIERRTELDFGHPIDILEPAYSIVIDAILTCTTRTELTVRYGKPFTPDDMGQPRDCIHNLLSYGLKIEEFRRLAFRQLLGTASHSNASHLMQASSGLVAAMDVSWSQKCDPRETCAIKLVHGAIRYVGVDFSSVRQDSQGLRSIFGESFATQPFKLQHLDRQGRKFVVLEPSPFEDPYQVDAYVSVSGSSLHLRQYLLRSNLVMGKAARCPVSWINAVDNVTLVTHLRHEPHANSEVTKNLHSTAGVNLASRKMIWLSPVSQIETGKNDLVVIDTNGDEMVKLFTVARYALWEQHKWKIFVHHEGHILESLLKACEEAYSIVII